MRKRGRVSSAELATVVVDAGRCMPASPPPELTDAQATIWRNVVGSLPNDWFTRAAHPILVSYCQHVCRAQLLEKQIIVGRQPPAAVAGVASAAKHCIIFVVT
jgi:hypothetical protein